MPRRRHLSPSLAVSLLALFLALGGIAWAAAIPRNSVGTSQLRDNAVVSTKIKRSAVTSAGIRDRNVARVDLADGAVERRAIRDEAVSGAKLASRAVGGRAIADGAVGARAIVNGSIGPAELAIRYVSVPAFSPVIDRGETGYRNVRAQCPAGHRVVGGGGGWVGPTTTDPLETPSFLTGSRPFPPSATGNAQTGWEVYGNDSSPGSRRLMAVAICVPVA